MIGFLVGFCLGALVWRAGYTYGLRRGEFRRDVHLAMLQGKSQGMAHYLDKVNPDGQ